MGFAVCDQPLTMRRNGFKEQVWYHFACSRVRIERGEVVGLLDVTSGGTVRHRALEQLPES